MSDFFDTFMAVQLGVQMAQRRSTKRLTRAQERIVQLPSPAAGIDPNLPPSEWLHQHLENLLAQGEEVDRIYEEEGMY